MHTQEVVQEVVVPQEHTSKSAIFLSFICKNFETQEVKNLYRKELQKLPQASRRSKKLFLSTPPLYSPGQSLWFFSPFYSNIFCSVEFFQPIIYSVAAKGNHARAHVKSCLRKWPAFPAFSAMWTLPSFRIYKFKFKIKCVKCLFNKTIYSFERFNRLDRVDFLLCCIFLQRTSCGLNFQPQKKLLCLAEFKHKRPTSSHKKLPDCRYKNKFLHMRYYFWVVLY